MNKPLTVKQLYKNLESLIKEEKGDYQIFLSDDEEGNGFHACWYSPVPADTMKEEDRRFYEAINCDIECLDDKKKAVYLG